MPRSEDPDMQIPGGTILAVYPGADPVDLEELVAIPIEDAVNEIDDIKRISTYLRDGVVAIEVEFEFGTDAKDKYDDVVQKVNSIKPELPDQLLTLETRQWSTSDVTMMQIALVSEKATYAELKRESGRIERELKKIRGVRKVETEACPEQEVRISIDMEKMAVMNITLDHLMNAIASNNQNIPGGKIDISGGSFSVKTSGSYNNMQEIENTVVHSYNGKIVYLKDIAKVELDYEDQKYYARFEGRNAIFVKVEKKEGLNVFDITGKIKPVIEEFKSELKGRIEISYVFDQAEQVDIRIDDFISNLLQGIILVGLIILLALGFRSSIIVIIAIPLSIVMGLGAIDLMGYGIQQISISGLVVALGLLVDNSIVIVENIRRFIKMGYSPAESAVKGTSQIGWAVISSTATTILAFVPIVMMPDKAGEFIKSLPLVIIASLVFSLLIALSLSPLVASRVYRNLSKHKAARESYFQRLLKDLIEGPYRRSLAFALRNKILALSIAIAALLISLFMFRYVGLSFFPKAEKPQFMIRVNTPDGTNIDKTDQVARYVESVLDTMNIVRYYATNVGHGNPRIYYNVFPKDFDETFAEIFVELKRYNVKEFDVLIAELRWLFSSYPGAKITVKEFEQGTPLIAPVMIYVYGNNLDVLRKVSEDVEQMVKIQDGAINVENQLARRKTDLYININREKAGIYGVPLSGIDLTIRTAVNGIPVSEFHDKEGEKYDIVLRMPFEDKIKIGDIEKIYVSSVTGKQIPLSQLATVQFRESPSMISRYNLDRTSLITADITKYYTLDEIMDPVLEKLEDYKFPKSYGYYISGELESRQESFGGMQIAIIIALISIFAVLVLQFKSFRQPLIIYSAIPFAVIGMIWALLITGNTFSFSAFIGLISLVGIVINNSIILVDYTNQLRLNGKDIIAALKESGETRFTPIILTTLTTIGGLLPLTLRGGSMWAPMGWTIIGGLLGSTMLTLIIVPVLYKLFSGIRMNKSV